MLAEARRLRRVIEAGGVAHEGARGYGEHARARYVGEPPKDSGASRGAFQRDRARVLHSAGFRRLAAKTQVFHAGEDDFPRTRLTHSLEVAQIAREMGERLGCDADVVDTAGLAHDLGHPPFGHNGEAALDAVAGPAGGFEGNAQTLRVLTRLEAKILHPAGGSVGLNLTRAALDAATKYPWPRRDGERKFGVYADDRPIFDWLRADAPADGRCLEAQVMDWADDVAYSVHDVEDGVHSGHVRLAVLDDPAEREALAVTATELYSSEPVAELVAVLDDLLELPALRAVGGYDGSHGAQVTLKRATSVLTGRLVRAAVDATRAVAGDGPLSRYAADLVVPRRTRAECALLKGIAARYVMGRPGMEAIRVEQRDLLTDLAAALTQRAPDGLEPALAAAWKDATDDTARLRVVDQVASLTDHSVRSWHRRFCGPNRG
jgi:dGTPase